MSNFRIFCWGWLIAAFANGVINLLGIGQEPGLIRMMKTTIIALGNGIAFVAVFGDRSPSHD